MTRGERFNAEAVLTEVEGMDADGVLDSRTLLSFTISFQPNQTSLIRVSIARNTNAFSSWQTGTETQRSSSEATPTRLWFSVTL